MLDITKSNVVFTTQLFQNWRRENNGPNWTAFDVNFYSIFAKVSFAKITITFFLFIFFLRGLK